MRNSCVILAAILATAAALPAVAAEGDAAAPQAVTARAGQMIYATSGQALMPIYRLTPAGEPQVIVQGRYVTVPTATLSMSGRKLTTSLSIADLRRLARQ